MFHVNDGLLSGAVFVAIEYRKKEETPRLDFGSLPDHASIAESKDNLVLRQEELLVLQGIANVRLPRPKGIATIVA
jgi:hypothetical protein